MSSEIAENTQIKVTPKALKEIIRLKNESNISSEYGLRIGVKGGGCSGFTYTMGFDSMPKESDSVIEFEDLKIFVDGKSLFYLNGTELDFSDGLNGKGFSFKNPNAQKTCGCGNSFGV